jgi:peptide/nickel transport system permease protein
MNNYIARRVLLLIPMLIGISIISYAIIRLAPGDPTKMIADPDMLTADQVAELRSQLGLDRPLPIQYLKTMESLVEGNLRSFTTRQLVLTEIGDRLPTTLTLTGLAILFGFGFGILLGAIQALRPYSRLDHVATFLSLFGFAVPTFWLAVMLVLIFSVKLDWLPASGIRPPDEHGWNPLVIWKYLILPTFVLGSNLLASVARYTRSSMLDALSQDYIRTARAKGLRERAVIVRHALRNSLLPVITLLAVQIPFLIGGSVAVETIFALPGVGRLALDSVINRDYPVILTLNVMVASLVLIANLLADIAYGFADPRIRVNE